MYIAICDDSAPDLKQLGAITNAFAQRNASNVRFELFTNPEQMLLAAREKRFTHYLLDVVMPVMDGVTAAQEIRSFDTEAKIIFLTTSREFAYESYRVKAYDYLLKPISEADLTEVLSQLLHLERAAEACMVLQDGSRIFRLPYSQISHVEVSQKKLYFTLIDGQVRQAPGTITEAEKTLCGRREFFRIHRSYIINLQQVSALSPEGCMMFTGHNLPVSRLLFRQVQEHFMAQLFSDKG